MSRAATFRIDPLESAVKPTVRSLFGHLATPPARQQPRVLGSDRGGALVLRKEALFRTGAPQHHTGADPWPMRCHPAEHRNCREPVGRIQRCHADALMSIVGLDEAQKAAATPSPDVEQDASVAASAGASERGLYVPDELGPGDGEAAVLSMLVVRDGSSSCGAILLARRPQRCGEFWLSWPADGST